MNVVVFEIEKNGKKAVISVSTDKACFAKEIRDDIILNEGYLQLGLMRFTEPRNWLPEDYK